MFDGQILSTIRIFGQVWSPANNFSTIFGCFSWVSSVFVFQVLNYWIVSGGDFFDFPAVLSGKIERKKTMAKTRCRIKRDRQKNALGSSVSTERALCAQKRVVRTCALKFMFILGDIERIRFFSGVVVHCFFVHGLRTFHATSMVSQVALCPAVLLTPMFLLLCVCEGVCVCV
jgi:hypothetical protein